MRREGCVDYWDALVIAVGVAAAIVALTVDRKYPDLNSQATARRGSNCSGVQWTDIPLRLPCEATLNPNFFSRN